MQLIVRKYLIFFTIIFLAVFLRLWQLDMIPPGVHSDEADTGYSAYSILKIGVSQYGTFNPLAIEEFNGGTHPPVYTYSLIPLINFFGLNIFVERLPSAIFGILTVFIIFFLVKKITLSTNASLIASLLMAVNPWSIHISRQGLLESVAVFFVVFGVLLFFYGKEKKYMYLLSALIFGISLHVYDAPKIFVPLFIFILILYQKKDFLKVKKYFFGFLIIFFLFFILMAKALFADKQINDFNSVSLIDFSKITRTTDEERNRTLAPLWASSIVHNKITVAVKEIATNYFNIFTPNWLFLNGQGNLQQAVGNHGEFNFFELPFFFIGLFMLFKKKEREAFILLAWLLIAAIPGALTDTGNFPYRSVLILPVPIIFSAFGIVNFWEWCKKYPILISYAIKCIFILIALFSISSYLFTYFFDYPVYASEWWFKQRGQSLDYLVSLENKYDKIYVVGGIEWPILYSFRNKVNPKEFQNLYEKNPNLGYKDNVFTLGKYSFIDLNLKDIGNPSSFFLSGSLVLVDVSNLGNLPGKEHLLKKILGSDGLRVVYELYSIEN